MPLPKFRWWKFIAIWIVFLLLHFSYETFPNTLFQIIGEDGETTFFHMKMLFFAYSFVGIGEYFIRRTRIADLGQFAVSRALIATAYPWLTITIWFTTEAILGQMLAEPWELIFANVATLLGIYLAIRLEEVLDPLSLRPALRGMILLVFLAALLSYVAFSFRTPEYFFSTPPGF